MEQWRLLDQAKSFVDEGARLAGPEVLLETGDVYVSVYTGLRQSTTVLDRLLADGVERYGVYWLRAQVLALRGDADGAMLALRHAADLGWRDSLEAAHDPALNSLQSRNDFHSLIARIGNENSQMKRKSDPAAP